MRVHVVLVTWFGVFNAVSLQRPRQGSSSALPSLNLAENFLQLNKIIDRVNSQQALWKAGRNFGENTTVNDLVDLLGVEWSISTVLFLRKMNDPNWPPDERVPEFFDAREKWKNCTVIGEILDQSQCGSCWAMAPAQVATDRYCIASGGRHNIRLSTQEILDCAIMRYRRGCKGGMPAEAYQFMRKHGLVSGGTFGSEEGCQPYFMPKCAHHGIGPFTPCSRTQQKIPVCKTKCTNDKYSVEFKDDLRKFNTIYKLGTNEKWIQKDIMTYGPLSTQFQVHEDFFLYKSGVYEPMASLFLSPQGTARGHTVKIIGWGTEKGIPYWLCINSWNEHWGDRGIVKMRRRSPLLLLELLMYGALPTIDTKFFQPQYQPKPPQSPPELPQKPPQSPPQVSQKPPQSPPQISQKPPQSPPQILQNPPQSPPRVSQKPPQSPPQILQNPPQSPPQILQKPPPQVSQKPPQSPPQVSQKPPQSPPQISQKPPQSPPQLPPKPPQSPPQFPSPNQIKSTTKRFAPRQDTISQDVSLSSSSSQPPDDPARNGPGGSSKDATAGPSEPSTDAQRHGGKSSDENRERPFQASPSKRSQEHEELATQASANQKPTSRLPKNELSATKSPEHEQSARSAGNETQVSRSLKNENATTESRRNDQSVARASEGEKQTSQSSENQTPAARLQENEHLATVIPGHERSAFQSSEGQITAAKSSENEQPAFRSSENLTTAARLPEIEEEAAEVRLKNQLAARSAANQTPATKSSVNEHVGTRLSENRTPAARMAEIEEAATQPPSNVKPAARSPSGNQTPAAQMKENGDSATELLENERSASKSQPTATWSPSNEQPVTRSSEKQTPVARLSENEQAVTLSPEQPVTRSSENQTLAAR
nr:PREDICTED: uncharacterized protein LOC109037280 [Bemisia tabaci]